MTSPSDESPCTVVKHELTDCASSPRAAVTRELADAASSACTVVKHELTEDASLSSVVLAMDSAQRAVVPIDSSTLHGLAGMLKSSSQCSQPSAKKPKVSVKLPCPSQTEIGSADLATLLHDPQEGVDTIVAQRQKAAKKGIARKPNRTSNGATFKRLSKRGSAEPFRVPTAAVAPSDANELSPASLGIPEEAHPQDTMKGKFTYTIVDGHGVRIQVLTKPKAFYIKRCLESKASYFERNSPTIAWKEFGGAAPAWEHAKKITGWQS